MKALTTLLTLLTLTLTQPIRECTPDPSIDPSFDIPTALFTRLRPHLIHMDMAGSSAIRIGPHPLYYAIEHASRPWSAFPLPDGSVRFRRAHPDLFSPRSGCDLHAEATVFPVPGFPTPDAARWRVSDFVLGALVGSNASFFLGEAWSERRFVFPQRWEVHVNYDRATDVPAEEASSGGRLVSWGYRVECPRKPEIVVEDKEWCRRTAAELDRCDGEMGRWNDELNVRHLAVLCDEGPETPVWPGR